MLATDSRSYRVSFTVTVTGEDVSQLDRSGMSEEDMWRSAAEDAFHAVYADGAALDIERVEGE